MFQLVNTNFLVPIITTYNSLEIALGGLQRETLLRLQEYTENIYMVENGKENIIYTSDGINIYLSKLMETNEKKIIYTNKKITHMGTEYYQTITEQELTFDTDIKPDMNIKINEKKNSNVRFVNDIIVKEQNTKQISIPETSLITNNITNNITNSNVANKIEVKDEVKDDKKEEMIKMIEEVNELYQKELSKIRKLQLNLKTFDAKLKKLERTKMDNIINNIIRTQSEYRTWKKIKYSIKDDNDDTDVLKPISELEETNEIVSIDKVPILFLSKFNYMENIQKNESIVKLLDEINQLNLNDLYSDNSLPNNNIVQFCNKYMKLSKELHYHFDDHEWSYLEHEMNLNSTNKLGSNVVSSNKIE
jgi:hypothetical protein